MTVAQVQEEAARRGLTINRRGRAWLITGPGVRIMVAQLYLINPGDLTPGEVSRSQRLQEEASNA